MRRPHEEVTHLAAVIGPTVMPLGDFTHVPTHSKFLALMPQWDFLDFLVQHGRRYPAFKVMMQANVTDLKAENGRVGGVVVFDAPGWRRASTPISSSERTGGLRRCGSSQT